MSSMDQLRCYIWNKVREQSREQVRERMSKQVWDQIWKQVGDPVYTQVKYQTFDRASSGRFLGLWKLIN